MRKWKIFGITIQFRYYLHPFSRWNGIKTTFVDDTIFVPNQIRRLRLKVQLEG